MRWVDRARAVLAALTLATCGGAVARAQQSLVPGPLMISGATATPADKGGQSTVLLGVTNKGTLEDHLVRAVCPAADTLVLQPPAGTAQDQTARGMPVPAGQTASFSGSGWHLVLSGLRAPLTTGEVFACTVRFDRSGEQLVEITVTQG